MQRGTRAQCKTAQTHTYSVVFVSQNECLWKITQNEGQSDCSTGS